MVDRITEKIIQILRDCHQAVTVKEINEFIGVEARTIRDRVNKLHEDGVIQKLEGDEKSFSFLLVENDVGQINIPVSHVRSIGDVIQFVGRINLFDLPKIGGIHPYRDNVSSGIQRARQGAWTKTLTKRLNSKESVMLNNISIYIDMEKVINFNSRKEIPSELIIEYKEYVKDSLKPAWLIDGQQRMWAILRLTIMRALGQQVQIPNPFNAPVTILVGDFKNDDDRIKQLSKWFVAANETKNLPRSLIAELESRLLSKGVSDDELANPGKAADATIMNWLNRKEESPFYEIIQSESNPQGFVSNGSIMSIIAYFREKISLEGPNDKSNVDTYNLLIDYYWVIRTVWGDDWIKPPSSTSKEGSRLLHPLGIGSLAFFTDYIAPLDVLVLSRNKRLKEFFRRFMRISDDIDWKETSVLKDYKNLKGDLQRFTKDRLLPVYRAQIGEHVPEDELEELINSLPDEFMSIIEDIE